MLERRCIFLSSRRIWHARRVNFPTCLPPAWANFEAYATLDMCLLNHPESAILAIIVLNVAEYFSPMVSMFERGVEDGLIGANDSFTKLVKVITDEDAEEAGNDWGKGETYSLDKFLIAYP